MSIDRPDLTNPRKAGHAVGALLMMLCLPAAAADSAFEPAHAECSAETHPEPAELVELIAPDLVGVSLDDLRLDSEAMKSPAWQELADDASMVARHLRHKGVLDLGEVLSTSVVSMRQDRVIVDVVGRAPRFQDTDSQKNKLGRIGVMRVQVPVASQSGICDVGEPELVWERSLTELDLRYRVSTTEWVGLVSDATTGFRRVWPLGGGGVDRGVRNPGVISSLTPTTEDGLLEKTYAWRNLNSPWYFRNKPYLPISVGRTWKRADGSFWKGYTESNIAFHIWQDKGFERGFFSHGCMRLRTEDLAELAAYVFGAPRPIPVVLQVPPVADARHPFPFDRVKYWELINAGTPEKPKTRLKYMLYDMQLGKLPLPADSEFRALDFLEKPIRPDVQTSP